MPAPAPLRISDTVRLRGQRKTAVVVALYSDIKGGVRLDRMLSGFFSWNESDLVVVKRAARKAAPRIPTVRRGDG